MEGGPGRCPFDNSKQRLLSCQDIYLQHPDNHLYQAAERLKVILSGTSYNIFSQEILSSFLLLKVHKSTEASRRNRQ